MHFLRLIGIGYVVYGRALRGPKIQCLRGPQHASNADGVGFPQTLDKVRYGASEVRRAGATHLTSVVQNPILPSFFLRRRLTGSGFENLGSKGIAYVPAQRLAVGGDLQVRLAKCAREFYSPNLSFYRKTRLQAV